VRKGDDLTTFIVQKVMKNPEVLTFRIPKSLLRPVEGKFYFYADEFIQPSLPRRVAEAHAVCSFETLISTYLKKKGLISYNITIQNSQAMKSSYLIDIIDITSA
jgi:hypothetical protein